MKKEARESIDCSVILIDLSGYTQLIYQAAHKPEMLRTVITAMTRLFEDAVRTAEAIKEVKIISTTGDGFYAIATGATPSRTALRYSMSIQSHFETQVKALIHSVPFRQRMDLRIAMHHGVLHRIDIAGLLEGDAPIYIGDALNLISRVINSQVARKHGVAITRAFYRRLMMTKGELPIADEVILDRNRYPEPIEIYKLPTEITDMQKTKSKR